MCKQFACITNHFSFIFNIKDCEEVVNSKQNLIMIEGNPVQNPEAGNKILLRSRRLSQDAGHLAQGWWNTPESISVPGMKWHQAPL